MCSLECKLIKVDWGLHFWLLKDTYFLCFEALIMLVNNLINIFLRNLKHYFILFLIIKYWWILRMFFLNKLWSIETLYTLPFKKTSLCSYFVKSFDGLPKKLYQLMLSFVLNLETSFSFTYK